jgi:phosphinothricin acetyltransferase
MDKLHFQQAAENDLDAIVEVYNYYIQTTTATFDIGKISREEFRQRIFLDDDKYQTYLLRYNDVPVGFCFLTQFKKKKAYDRTAEIGVYLKPEFTGRRIGCEVVTFLENIAKSKKFGVIVASISGENIASIKLFQKMGYEKCAHYKKVGEKFGRLLDVVDYQRSGNIK